LQVVTQKRKRRLALIAVLLTTGAICPAAVASGQYGELIAHGKANTASTPATNFHHVRPAPVFWLVVTDSAEAQPEISWSIQCFNSARRESGGATGQAIVTHGRWVKRVRADWITHPALCSGGIQGSAESSPVVVRIYAD
jgi:hypothetical protein